jgi:hypothetical protein
MASCLYTHPLPLIHQHHSLANEKNTSRDLRAVVDVIVAEELDEELLFHWAQGSQPSSPRHTTVRVQADVPRIRFEKNEYSARLNPRQPMGFASIT